MKLNTQDLTIRRTDTGYTLSGNLGLTSEDGDGFPAFELLEGKVHVIQPVPVLGKVDADLAFVLKKGGS